MEIIAHRGFWVEYMERNTLKAMQRAADNEMGTETDFRDYNQVLKISHNVAKPDSLDADKFFAIFEGMDKTLALNVKADGIQLLLKELLKKYNITNYFCFDMSIPDTIGYIQEGLKFFTRESEYEPIPAFYLEADGVWVDGFKSDEWITEDKIEKYLEDGKRVCLVSPDLHGRDYRKKWEEYRGMSVINDNNIILCTDYPDEARRFFYE